MAVYNIDGMLDTQAQVDGKYVVARPENYKYRGLIERLSDAWEVFIGSADAVKYYKQ